MRILAGSFSTLVILILAGCGKESTPTPAPVPVKTETVASQEVGRRGGIQPRFDQINRFNSPSRSPVMSTLSIN